MKQGVGNGADRAAGRENGRHPGLRAKGEAATLAVPNCIYATSANFGRLGLQAWANLHPRHAHPRTGYATPASLAARSFCALKGLDLDDALVLAFPHTRPSSPG